MKPNKDLYHSLDVENIEKELERLSYQNRFLKSLKETLFILITVAATAVLIANFFVPILQIYGGSMAPTLHNKDIVLTVKNEDISRGDIVGFYYNNKILVKRVIALPGEWVTVGEDGIVTVDGEELRESYVEELSLGHADITFPYQVPEGQFFVLGDHRSVSVDSRNEVVGSVSEEQIIGKLVYRLWPLNSLGMFE